VKRRVEYGVLRDFITEDLSASLYTDEVYRVMQRSEFAEPVDCCFYLWSYGGSACELHPAMNNAMAN
jgi:hypothetical protein